MGIVSRRRSILGGLGLVLAGCSPPVAMTQSNRDTNYDQKLGRVVVAVALRQYGFNDNQNATFVKASELQQSFTSRWAPMGVSVEVVDVVGRPQAQADAVTQSGAQQVLELKLAGYQLASYVVDGYSVDASVLDVASKKRVWRAIVDFRAFATGGRLRTGPLGKPIGHRGEADELVDLLTAKLKTDGLM
jgi:hypothetical protein